MLMTNKHVKSYLMSLASREMQIKTKLRYITYESVWNNNYFKKLTITSADKYWEQLEFYTLLVGMQNCTIYSGEPSCSF